MVEALREKEVSMVLGNGGFVSLSEIVRIVDCSCTFCSVSLTFLSASIWKRSRRCWR
jgi:hypothetical protein